MAISIPESVKLSFNDFLSRKLRNLITIFSIILGTMSIITILSIVHGINEESMRWMNEMGGKRSIDVGQNWQFQGDDTLRRTFTMRELEYIKESIPPVTAFTMSILTWWKTISYGQNTAITYQCYGTVPDFQLTHDWTVQEGRFISNFDYVNSNEVIVIGTNIQKALFGNKQSIGQYVTIDNKRLMVIGVMRHRSMELGMASMFGNENPLDYMNSWSMVPLSTMINKMGEHNGLDSFHIKAIDEQQVYTLVPLLENILLNLRQGKKVFRVDSILLMADKQSQSMLVFKLVFYFISTISMLVGGIVVMNIMLATIKERTREIGIRIAVGARQFDIFLQFLLQTVVITFCGGCLGALVAIFTVTPIGKYLKLSAKLNISIVVVALCVSVVVGLFFGIYPAVKASKLDPVKALRNE